VLKCCNLLPYLIIGFREDLNKKFTYPEATHNSNYIKLKDAIWDLRNNIKDLITGSFSTIYMSRNRKRTWEEVSFTIQAGGRHAPLHPDSPDMLYVETDKRIFDPESKNLIRRLTVRECARVQTFPDWFEFISHKLDENIK
jgi:DNA (cytosine-5)-methyltransferase 1